MKIYRFQFNMLSVNTYVLWDENTRECALVDVGCYYPQEEVALAQFIEENQLSVKYLLATHLHFDHCFGNAFAANRYGVPLSASQADEFMLSQMLDRSMTFNIPFQGPVQPIGQYITEESVFYLGNEELRVISLPGHTPGGVAFYAPQSGFLLSGDSLFELSIGRVDLPGGDFVQLIKSIRYRLFTLPDDTVVYPGHGPETTIGNERNHNPFFN